MSFSFSRFSAVVVLCASLSGHAWARGTPGQGTPGQGTPPGQPTPGQGAQDKKDQKEAPQSAPVVPPPPADPGGTRLGATAAVDPKTYVIEPEDIVSVRVWREPELSGLFTVRPDGKISMHLVGEIQAGGITPDQLQTRVVEALQTVINRPQVVAAVQEVRSKRYYISGEVNRPGEYRLQTL